MVTLIIESTKLILSQSDFSVKIKGQTSWDKQIDKGTCVGKETIYFGTIPVGTKIDL